MLRVAIHPSACYYTAVILNATAEARFWPKVDKSGPIPAAQPQLGPCWLWTRRCDKDGYGRFRPDGANSGDAGAHRVSFVLAGGVLLAGQLALHHCDNPPCVNPTHLYAGTHRQNTADMDSRGRRVQGNTSETACRGQRWRELHPKTLAFIGAANPAARLTEDDVRAIRAAFANGETQTSIGLRMGIPQPHVSRIVLRRSWANVA